MRNMTANKAFTLIEILLVIAIMALLAITAIPYVGRSIERVKFQSVFSRIEDMFFDARDLALANAKITDCADVDGDGDVDEEVVAAGYGLNVEDKSGKGWTFTVFIDSHGFSSGYYKKSDSRLAIGACEDVVKSEYVLPEGFSVEISPPSRRTVYNFIYLPPDAAFMVTGEKGDIQDEDQYEIKLGKGQFSRSITVTNFGVPRRGDLITQK